MEVGVPKETKPMEGRVALVPAAVAELVHEGHHVHVQAGAGELSGYSDQRYIDAGARIEPDAESLYGSATLIVKVKEPVEGDLACLRADHLLFCFLHLAALPQLTRQLLEIGLTAVGFETVEVGGKLPLLAPMSEIAGSIAVQAGAHLLHRPMGGKGLLLGGTAGTRRGKVVIIGAGTAGRSAAHMAHHIGAEVEVFDVSSDALNRLRGELEGITTLYSQRDDIAASLPSADLLVGAVLVTGARAPCLVSSDMVAAMQPGSVIIDIAVDQGGCIETIRPTDYANPTYRVSDVIHMGVTNMPGAVPHTSSQALSGAILPWAKKLAAGLLEASPELMSGINLQAGRIVHRAVRESME